MRHDKTTNLENWISTSSAPSRLKLNVSSTYVAPLIQQEKGSQCNDSLKGLILASLLALKHGLYLNPFRDAKARKRLKPNSCWIARMVVSHKSTASINGGAM